MTSTALVSLTNRLADRFGIANDGALIDTLKQTAFKSKEPVSDAQLSALMVVANEYGLNPFTREIYAYPDQYKGIVPVVGIDGWIRIVNEHPQCDGWEFEYEADGSAVTCRQYRKDRSRPLPATEYLEECKRGTDPWKNMPRRMLRHKAFIQSARLAYGFALYDEEEGAAAAGLTIDAETGEIVDPQPRGPRRSSERAAAAPTQQQPAAASTAETPAAKKTEPPPNPTPNAAGGAITAGQVAYLRNKLKAAGIEEQSICDRYQVTGLELLTSEQFDEQKSALLAMT